MAMTDTEKNLIAGCLQRDKAAWDAFVVQYANLVYHTIKKTLALHHATIVPDAVDDLFQEVFLSLVKDDFDQLRRFRGDRGCTVASWVRMIAARRTIDHLRKLNKAPDSLDGSLPTQPANQADEGSEGQLQLLADAVAKLQPRERVIVDLLFTRGLSAQQVASNLHLTVGAVYTHKSRIMAKLRGSLEKLAV
jgi:RNA polymerase sigma factor (sigma-70 family)